MEKLKMQTPNLVDENIEKIGKLFPDCLTESTGADGKTEQAIDFDKLKQELSKSIVDGDEERYQFTWPGKKQAIITANAPINKTLRPCREDSVDFDNTQNLYIEGDNLDVLKLLREDYLGKVKVIYIDPPYNTGNDFVYEDDFAQSTDDYIGNSGQTDDDGNRLVANTESNGRFHTDWLNMIYPRLKVARDFLSDDGVIFISIDDNEVENLKFICNEIFGKNNFVSQIAWQKVYSPKNNNAGISAEVEYILCYSKTNNWSAGKLERTPEMNSIYKNPDDDPNGEWMSSDASAPGAATHQGMVYAIQSPFTGENIYPTVGRCWQRFQDDLFQIMNGWASYRMENIHDEKERAAVCGVDVDSVRKGVKAFVLNEPLDVSREKAEQILKKGHWPVFYFTGKGKGGIRKKTYLKDMEGRAVTNLWPYSEVGHNDEAKKEVATLFDGHAPFDTPKPVRLMKRILKIASSKNCIVLDFFSGSATIGQAVMEVNAEDNGNRKFILVQLPEVSKVPNYETLCNIGEERLIRAGEKIFKERKIKQIDNLSDKKSNLDVGFRVLKLDSSNMKDVYYKPSDVTNDIFTNTEDNIKEDRTDEDLLFQVLLEMAVPISAKIRSEEICGKKVMIVDNDYLIACFDKDITDEVVTDIAKRKPQYFVMRDSSVMDDSVITNFETIFQTYSKDTVRKIL